MYENNLCLYFIMKLALLLYGLTKETYFHHWDKVHEGLRRGNRLARKKMKVDWEKSYKNYQEYIFDYFKKKGYDIDIYFVSNEINYDERVKLERAYKCVSCAYMSSQKLPEARNLKVEKVIELCLESKRKYDHVLITRFDLYFMKDFNKSNIQFDKLNIVSSLNSFRGNLRAICDNFYLMPYEYLEKFLNVLKQNRDKMAHWIGDKFENINGKEFINFILDEKTRVRDLSFYKIIREAYVPVYARGLFM